MYERMLNKQVRPSKEELALYCGKNGVLFTEFNDWITSTFQTEEQIVFPYGNSYGWGIAHKNKKKLLCNVFAEKDAFTVMMRLTNRQWESIYDQVKPYMKDYIDHKYPCNDGGWIHYRLTGMEQMEDIQKAISAHFYK